MFCSTRFLSAPAWISHSALCIILILLDSYIKFPESVVSPRYKYVAISGVIFSGRRHVTCSYIHSQLLLALGSLRIKSVVAGWSPR